MRADTLVSLVVMLSLATQALAQDERADRLAKILAIDGWDESRFAKFFDDQPVTIDEQLDMARLARRLGTLDVMLFRVEEEIDDLGAVVADPDESRGRLFRLKGKAIAMARVDLSERDQQLLDIEALYAVKIRDNLGACCTVLTLDTPSAWNELTMLDELSAVGGVFTKISVDDAGNRLPIFVAPRIAWYPQRPELPTVSFGESVLGILGYDVSQLDVVEHRQRFTAREKTAFYDLMSTLSDVAPGQLVRYADRSLPYDLNYWQDRKTELNATDPMDDASRKSLVLSRVAARSAQDGKFSVAPFFNEPEKHVGKLVEFDGNVRRAVKIELGGGLTGQGDATAAEFGVDSYYEVSLFTGDSQNYPVIFCVRQLPPGFPTGNKLNEPVRVAGFFFKSWRFNTGRVNEEGEGQQLTAPLFLGSGPLKLVTPESKTPWGTIAGSTFVGIVAILWMIGWQLSRGDKQMEQKRRSLVFDAPSLEGPLLQQGAMPSFEVTESGGSTDSTDSESDEQQAEDDNDVASDDENRDGA